MAGEQVGKVWRRYDALQTKVHIGIVIIAIMMIVAPFLSAAGSGGAVATTDNVDVEGECALPPDVKVALYRIAQESLNNVAKHAEASQVNVSLHCQPSRVILSISDNGCGFSVDSIPPDHLGVGIMHERAEAIGAMLTVESEIGHGTEVVALWTE